MTRSLVPRLSFLIGAGSPAWGLLCAQMLALAAPAPALAQYKVTEPGGRVTYTDRPPSYAAVPAPGSQAAANGATGANGANGEEAALAAGLPYALRQVVQRYPVRLYTASGCAPCSAAQQFLQQRGVPLLEYGVNRSEDIDLLQREVGASELPVLMVGRQRLVGFAASDWQAMLDAAGYPPAVVLPAGYRAPAARLLAGTVSGRVEATAAPRAAATRAAPPAEPALSPVAPVTPGGFRF
ncbi:glutaredoxin family protein [Sphaerotilus microaerophilus]|uniref:Glutaredoxin domain-containing protein n=1 Tax=Sphaerotilus microaerophilus TaxID=2914710 RepID=A0ABM7YJY1_9BURK|nr:glutaredoxin family protein [Sphaerotilus sp. FB-5]BDI04674.1 hypothetical protein CATMQ487_16440 [Sphaerotilus sp. FB-5]